MLYTILWFCIFAFYNESKIDLTELSLVRGLAIDITLDPDTWVNNVGFEDADSIFSSHFNCSWL